MTKLLILDKDGTLITPVSGETFVQHPLDQKLLPGVVDAIERYVADGYTCAIASNQGGVASGHKSLEQAIAEMVFCLELIPQIQIAYFCPDFEGKECYGVESNGNWHSVFLDNGAFWRTFSAPSPQIFGNCRKPNPGMLQLAIAHFNAVEALMVGDRPEDEAAAKNAGIQFLWDFEWRVH